MRKVILYKANFFDLSEDTVPFEPRARASA